MGYHNLLGVDCFVIVFDLARSNCGGPAVAAACAALEVRVSVCVLALVFVHVCEGGIVVGAVHIGTEAGARQQSIVFGEHVESSVAIVQRGHPYRYQAGGRSSTAP